MRFLRLTLLGMSLLSAGMADADTVQLRLAGNATTVTFTYITQDADTIMVQRLDAEAVLVYKWRDLDLGWVRRNNPRVWEEREALLASERPGPKAAGPATGDDPFAQEVIATDGKSLARNLLTALQVALKGMSLSANRVDVVCAEIPQSENLFWLGFADLKRVSRLDDKAEPEAEPIEDEPKAGPTKGKFAAKAANRRTTESSTAEANARRDAGKDVGVYSPLGYLRMLAEGGTKGKPIWMMLRRAPGDREAIMAICARHAQQAGELADKPEGKANKTELLALKKALENCAASIGKVTRDTIAVEARLQEDCRSLLTLALR